jgi:hypothetical protein
MHTTDILFDNLKGVNASLTLLSHNVIVQGKHVVWKLVLTTAKAPLKSGRLHQRSNQFAPLKEHLLTSFRPKSLHQEFVKLPPVWNTRFTQIIRRQWSNTTKNVFNIPIQSAKIGKAILLRSSKNQFQFSD